MAKVWNPFLSTHASGRCGALIAINTRYGAVLRAWYPPVDSFSVSQTRYRREFWTPIMSAWNQLSAARVLAWNEYAEQFYPTPPSLSGSRPNAQNCFFKVNMGRLLSEQTIVSDPPLNPAAAYFPTLAIVWTVNGASLSWTPAIPAAASIQVRQTRNLKAVNRAPVRGTISNVFTNADSSPQLVTPPCGGGSTGGPGAAFNCGTYIHFHLRAIDSRGRMTPELFLPILAG